MSVYLSLSALTQSFRSATDSRVGTGAGPSAGRSISEVVTHRQGDTETFGPGLGAAPCGGRRRILGRRAADLEPEDDGSNTLEFLRRKSFFSQAAGSEISQWSDPVILSHCLNSVSVIDNTLLVRRWKRRGDTL